MSAYDSEGFILYTIVARGTKILAEHTNPIIEYGNFPRVALKILERIPPQNGKMSYVYDSYMFHYEVRNEIVFLCMCDGTFSKGQSFKFLKDIKELWFEKYQDEGKKVQNTYQMNKGFRPTIRSKMDYYNNDPKANKIKNIRGKIEVVKGKMMVSIGKVIQRGEKIDLLVSKTDSLNQNAQNFKHSTKNLKSAVLWANIKTVVIIAVAITIVVIIAFIILCGFPAQCLGLSFGSK